MTPVQLCAALQISRSTYYRLLVAGRLDRFALVPRIGPRRYSRAAVQAYLDREPPSAWRAARDEAKKYRG